MIPGIITIDISNRFANLLERILTTFGGKPAPETIDGQKMPALPRSTPLTSWRNPEVDAVLNRMFPCSEPFYTTTEILIELQKVATKPLPKWSTISVACIQRLHIKRGTPPPRPPKPAREPRKAWSKPRLHSVPYERIAVPVASPGVALPPVAIEWAKIRH